MKNPLMSESAQHYMNSGYAKAMSEVYGLMVKEVSLLRVVIMQNDPSSEEFKDAVKATHVLGSFSDKLKELIDAPEQKH